MRFAPTWAWHRKAVIRALGRASSSHKSPQKPTHLIYSDKTIGICEMLWKLNDYPCGVILKAQLPLLLDSVTHQQLLAISSSTLDRRLAIRKKHLKSKLYGATKPGLLLKNQVPIRTDFKGIKEPGHIELDTVSHSGPHASGEFIYTVNAVDIQTSWVMRRAVLGKGERGVQLAIDSMRCSAPFPFLDIDFDNGSEFLNWHLIRYCQTHAIGYTRSRPNEKNDQAHIEQKNRTHVRNLFGRQRFDRLDVMPRINDLYLHELDIFHNFFRPCVKLKSKRFIGSKLKRKFTKPMTPLQRVLGSPLISDETKKHLRITLAKIDPIALKKSIDLKLRHIKRLQLLREAA